MNRFTHDGALRLPAMGCEKWMPACVLLLAISGMSGVTSASMVGATVVGSLESPLGSQNLFDPTNGQVPTEGYGNSSGTSVLIANSQAEFAWFQGGGTVTAPGLDSWVADFEDDVLTITFRDNYGGFYLPSYFLFQSTAFAGRQVSLIGADAFAPYAGQPTTASIDGDVLRLTVGEDGINPPGGVFSNSYSITPVPLPAAVWLLLSGLAGLGVLGRRRKTA